MIVIQGCVSIDNEFTGIPPGIWRAKLIVDTNIEGASIIEESKSNFEYTELPFNFEVKYVNEDSFYLELINGEERIMVSDIIIGLDRKTAKDTVVINFPVYDTYIKAIYEEGYMEGDWYINYKDGYSIPFKAQHGQDERFKRQTNEINKDINGKWLVSFDYDTKEPYPAIGTFDIAGNGKTTGTFKTETGDYRFLEGLVDDNKLKLSVFDGAHAFLFEAKLLEDETLVGTFYSGKHYKSNWTAKRSTNDTLSSVYELTKLKAESDGAFNFSFQNTDGDTITLNDDRFNGKAKIVQIIGTWCPNCRDESNFLKSFYEEKPENLEIISVAFERYRETDKSLNAIKRYKEKMNIPYDILYGGYYDKSEASQAFPMLNKIISYPTMIFLNTDNSVHKIHTGFNGPATNEYEAFKSEFDKIIKEITEIKE
jgi:thiol-disulfide isomerase/thioredoxin